MPDIAMCRNHDCRDRERCYRYRAVPYERGQSYAAFDGPQGEKNCTHFAAIWESTKVLTMEESGGKTQVFYGEVYGEVL